MITKIDEFKIIIINVKNQIKYSNAIFNTVLLKNE